jgi:hypothetical protein
MITMESSTIQAKESDRAMIRDAMATYTGPINVVTPPPGTNALAEWRGVNQIALPGSSLQSKDQNELAAKVRRLRELAAQGAGAVSIAKSLKLSRAGIVELARVNGVALNG